jgi:hypothetical protein
MTLVQGPDPVANKEALTLLESLSGVTVETVRGFAAIREWMDTPRIITNDGYVVSGIESIRQFAGRLNHK